MKEGHVMEERLKVAHSTAQRTRERAVLAEVSVGVAVAVVLVWVWPWYWWGWGWY